jgi:hypothetical protein
MIKVEESGEVIRDQWSVADSISSSSSRLKKSDFQK